MRAKWPILLKVQLMGMLGINRAKHSGNARTKGKTAGMYILVGFVGLLILFYAALFAVLFCSQGLGDRLPAFAVAVASLLTFIFTLFQGRSLLFSSKDYDTLMSLPVAKWEIILSRLLCTYLVNLAFLLAIVLPMSVVYFIFEGFSAAMLGILLLAAVTAPLLPVSVAAALSTLIAGLTARLRFKNLLQTVLGIAVFLAAFCAGFAFSYSPDGGEPDMGAMFTVLAGRIYPPALLVDITASQGAAWGIFAFAGICLAAGAIFVAVVSAFYQKISTALLAQGARVGYKAKDVRSSSAFAALTRREFKRLVSSPGYLLNGCSGAILLLLFSVVLLFVDIRGALGVSAEDAAMVQQLFASMGAGFMLILLGMSCPAASALSLEGQSRGLLFSLPVSGRQILLTKAMPTFIIDCAAGLIFAVLFGIRMGAGAAAWAALLLTALFFPAFLSLFGIFLNYKMPKYDWTNETQAVKNNIPMFILIFGAMIVGIAVTALSAFFGPWLMLGLDALFAALAAVLFFSFKKVKLYV